MQQPAVEKPKNQLLPWFVLIVGGLFMIPTLPFTLLLVLMPLWKPDEVSFFSMLFTSILAGLCILAIRAMRRAFKSLRPSKTADEKIAIPHPEAPVHNAAPAQPTAKKPLWPWMIIVPGALLLIASGPGAMMLPIMPLYLAAMSTDSGTTPDHVPALIIGIGYALLSGYILLLVKAVNALRGK
ncbi:hypothetical protein [Planomicrobium sp. CPCC 101110]|uniref:hypothetical protein n=1 Tax=Planomicrobium sp. CPCC 101110 TaxID=2599619 RepID=UPI0011B72D8B|nr:hypothetical protein [Planomicrobium sp. CPCC 101110]TWT25124.1 hypothetical protein FQV30_12170 [Planomicrobium sp. CPCC 101110]